MKLMVQLTRPGKLLYGSNSQLASLLCPPCRHHHADSINSS